MKEQKNISTKELMKELTLLIKEEIVAKYKEEECALHMHFLNGQHFRVLIQEIAEK